MVDQGGAPDDCLMRLLPMKLLARGVLEGDAYYRRQRLEALY